MLPEFIELNRIRLHEDKTYGELAAEIGLNGLSTLHRLLNEEQTQPTDRTLYKIRRYLAARKSRRRSVA